MAEEHLTDVEAIDASLDSLASLPEKIRKRLKNEAHLSRALQDKIAEVAKRIENGEAIMPDQLARELNDVAEQHGCFYGIPLPDLPENRDKKHFLVMANRTPLAETLGFREARSWAEENLRTLNIHVRNSWHMLGDQTVSIVETTEGPRVLPEWDAGTRLRVLIDTALLRSRLSHLTAEAELRAQDALKKRINESQFASYVLNGIFPERSKRSRLHYIFRKGLPTLVLSTRGRNGKEEGMRVLAALCFHPMGYYTGTHCGIMCPTDEVIAELLMMRADEHRFWKMSGQWSASDPRSGL